MKKFVEGMDNMIQIREKIKNRFTNVRSRLLFMCLIGSLLVILIQAGLSMYYFTKMYNEQAKAQMQKSMTNMQSEIYNYIKDVENKLIESYNEDSLIRDLENNMGIDMLKDKYYNEAYTIRNTVFSNSNSVVSLYLYNKKNLLISSYQKSMTKKYSYPKDIYASVYDANAKKVQEYIQSADTTMLVSSYYNQNREDNILRFVLKLYKNSDTSKVIGYIVCDVDSRDIMAIMDKYITSTDMMIWLEPMQDRQAVAVGNIKGLSKKAYQKICIKIQETKPFIQESQSINSYMVYQKGQTKFNLYAYVLTPQKILSESAKVMIRTLFVILVLMILLLGFISSKISMSISKPLVNMIKTIRKIRQGDSDLRVELPKNKDEISVLGENFNEMLDEIHELMAEKYKTQMHLERAEYLTLQAQINPHFLYNTLETMSSIANIQNCGVVSNLSQALANIFRYTLNMSGYLATIAEEITHVRNYIYVMNVRNKDLIRYEFQIDKDTLYDTLPRVCLEPLVENALKHGLKNSKKEGKTVWIIAKHIEKELWITVKDNGVGANDAQVLEKINDHAFLFGEKGNSIGLTNINNRLKKIYGAAYGIQFESKQGVGAQVSMHLPIMQREDVEQWEKEHIGF